MKKYESYTIEDFLQDAYFIEWIRYQKKDVCDFWEHWEKQNPPNLKEFNEAEMQLRAIFSVDEKEVDENIVIEVWERIQSSIQKETKTIVFTYKKYWIAASIIALLGLSIWIVSTIGTSKNEPTFVQQKPILPGGNKAVLTLADGSRLVLDSAQDGAISRQGSVTVIKLDDGKLQYKGDEDENNTALTYNTISTPRGGQYQLVLNDGTKVWLNAASSLTFPTKFKGAARSVTLTGEGYFEVAKNAAKPFKVRVDDMEVKVLGTHFNISAYKDEQNIKATLLEGTVEVQSAGQVKKLKPGEQAVLQTSTHVLSKNRNVDLDEIMAWKNGFFYFDNTDLKTIMKRLERWYDIEVEITGNEGSRKFGGSISRNVPLSEVLKVLKESNIQVIVKDRKVRIVP